jgi:ComF family protein
LKRGPHFDATHAALRYAFPADRLVQSLKYGACLPVAVLLARLLRESLPRAPQPDILMPMPLHRNRLAARGFNQALEIARRLAPNTPRDFQRLDFQGLVRTRDTAPQADLPADLRHANVRNAFDCRLDLEGLSVAVIDDVMTTGATLNEVARILKRAGAARVENWVVARTQTGR